MSGDPFAPKQRDRWATDNPWAPRRVANHDSLENTGSFLSRLLGIKQKTDAARDQAVRKGRRAAKQTRRVRNNRREY